MKHLVAGVAVMLGVLSASTSAHAINCVSYVLSVTDFHIQGDAWAWWDAADHVYGRGFNPSENAVMVFSRTSRMHVGHVAVVRQIVSPREIIIDQANWHHGQVTRGVGVIDVSENNDWSQVKVEWTPGYFGGPFPITGFIYAPNSPLANAHVETARARVAPSRPAMVEATYRPSTNKGKLIMVQASAHQAAGHQTADHAADHKGKVVLANIPHAAMGEGLIAKTAQCAKPAKKPAAPASSKPILAKASKPAVAKSSKPATQSKVAAEN